MAQATSETGIALIKGFEQYRDPAPGSDGAVAYICPAGKWTIGWGHTGPETVKGYTRTMAECEQILRDDLRWAEGVVNSRVTRRLNQNQFDALTSFVFNLGESNFGGSTLLKLVNRGESAPGDYLTEFQKWRYATVKGVKQELAGLLRRRTAEGTLFNAPADAAVTVMSNGDVMVAMALPPPPPPPPAPAATPVTPEAEARGAGMSEGPAPAQPASQTTPAESQAMAQSVRTPPQKPLAASRTLWGAVLAFFAGIASFLGSLWEGFRTGWASLKATLGYDPLWILLVLFVLGIVIVIWARIDDQRRRTR